MSNYWRSLIAVVGAIAVLGLGLAALRWYTGRLDDFSACLRDAETVRVIAATGDSETARKAVSIAITVPAPTGGYDLASLDPTTASAIYATGGTAGSLMCGGTQRETGDNDVRTMANSGQITAEFRLDPVSGLPIEVRVVAIDLLFENGQKIDRIETGWVTVLPPHG
jgi:hypothetical protein